METYGQHSVARSVTLHLLPGVLIAAFYTLTAPVVRSLEFPSLMAIFLYILLVLVPFELGYLLYRSQRQNGDFSLRNVVLYREHAPGAQLIDLVVALFVWSGIFAVLLYPPLDASLSATSSRSYRSDSSSRRTSADTPPGLCV